MACFIRSSAFLNFLLTTHAWKNETFFSHHYLIKLYFAICKYTIRTKIFCYFCAPVSIWPSRNTVSYGNALTSTLLLPVWQAFTSTRNQLCLSDTSRIPLQPCLVFHSILNLILKTSFWANVYSFHKGLSYFVKHSIQRNMKRSGGTHEGAGQEKLFTRKKRNESITLQSKSSLFTLYISKIDGERLHIFEKSNFFDLEPLAMIQNSCHFSPLLILQIWKFGSPWTSPSVNSQWYIKKECSDMC